VIVVNGKAYPFSRGMTVGDALLLRGYSYPLPIAVYIRGILVHRTSIDGEGYSRRELQDGDELVVVDLMGGG
jgi:sulfur carrier protein ThiS